MLRADHELSGNINQCFEAAAINYITQILSTLVDGCIIRPIVGIDVSLCSQVNDRVRCEAGKTAIQPRRIENIALKPVIPMMIDPGRIDIVIQDMISVLQKHVDDIRADEP